MDRLKDIDDSIVEEARILLSFIHKNGQSDVRVGSPADIPLLLLLTFELLTAETIRDRPFRTPGQRARTLQKILDTLEQTLKLPMGHISGEGLATLDRRQLSDVVQIFIDIMKHCYPEQDRKTATPDGRRLTLSQLETPELGRILLNMTSTPDVSSQTVRPKKASVSTTTPKQVLPAKVIKPPAAFKGRLSTRPGSDKDRKSKEASVEKNKEATSSRCRRPSVVSTKAKRHGSGSQSSPMPQSRNSKYRQPVKRGKVSAQTSSLCSSIKLLEEFDYINRRVKEIQLQKEKLRDIIKELEQEETRLQYVISHIHQQAGQSMNKVSA